MHRSALANVQRRISRFGAAAPDIGGIFFIIYRHHEINAVGAASFLVENFRRSADCSYFIGRQIYGDAFNIAYREVIGTAHMS